MAGTAAITGARDDNNGDCNVQCVTGEWSFAIIPPMPNFLEACCNTLGVDEEDAFGPPPPPPAPPLDGTSAEEAGCFFNPLMARLLG